MKEKNYKFVTLIAVAFVAVLMISNIVSTKVISLGLLTFDGGTLLFPLSYIFGDVLTEVYGYKQSRKVIWMGFGCLVLMSITIMLVGILPPASDWSFQNDYDNILGFTVRIVIASSIAYFVGEFANSYILAKVKILMNGKKLRIRTIGSTIIGELLDTFIFITIAFYGVFGIDILIALMISNYIFKVGIEVIFTPITYLIVNKLKKIENEDTYDYKTDFNPFMLK